MAGGGILELDNETTSPLVAALTSFLNARSIDELVSQLFGVTYEEVPRAAALERLQQCDAAKSPNRPALARLTDGTGFLDVTVERVREGRVFVRDVLGGLRSIPEQRFVELLAECRVPSPADAVP